MELFIRIKDGQPFEHPILGSNFREAFADVNVDNLPPEFARFKRLERPIIGPYDAYEGVTYERDADGFTDVHHVKTMTDAEKTAKISQVKALPHPEGWVFNEAVCAWQPSKE